MHVKVGHAEGAAYSLIEMAHPPNVGPALHRHPIAQGVIENYEKMMLTLFFAPGSSSMAPHIALHEICAEFESRPLSFGKKENRAPEYLALNPEGKVPTLLIDGRPLTEVAAILFYLARRLSRGGLAATG
jgi:hypothetical protein